MSELTCIYYIDQTRYVENEGWSDYTGEVVYAKRHVVDSVQEAKSRVVSELVALDAAPEEWTLDKDQWRLTGVRPDPEREQPALLDATLIIEKVTRERVT